MSRGKDPGERVKYLLVAKAAGRCQICNEFLLTDSFTMTDNDDSNMAHIVASSPDGPRGDKERSHLLSRNINNLMLLCRKHHHMIDTQLDVYTEELLLKLKRKQEKRVADLGESINVEKTEIVILQSPIKGVSVNVCLPQVFQTIVLKKAPISKEGIPMLFTPHCDYRSKQYWCEADSFFKVSFGQVSAVHSWHPDCSFSVFPLAPIPLIIKLGYLFGDKIKVEVYQKFRVPDTWSWQTDAKTNTYFIKKTERHCGEKIAVVMSLSSSVAYERVTTVYDAAIIYEISATTQSVDSIKSEADLSAFWHTYQELFNEIKNTYPEVTEIALFPVVPNSAAFVIGSRYMPGIYPKIRIFDDDKGFFETISIGGKDD